jgi:hypothetical protein
VEKLPSFGNYPDVFPHIGWRPIREVIPPELLSALTDPPKLAPYSAPSRHDKHNAQRAGTPSRGDRTSAGARAENQGPRSLQQGSATNRAADAGLGRLSR